MTVPGEQLDLSNNEVKVVVTYHDVLGKQYETEQDIIIEPRDFTLLQKSWVVLMNGQRWIEGLLA